MDISEAHIQVQNAWDGVAAGYDAYVTPSHMKLSDEALRHVDLWQGARFLDVAAGSGSLSLTAARRGAQVLATDISASMLKCLEARARQERLENIETRVMDGHELELDDETFDVSASQFGVMLFPDMPRGMRELARVTKPGGRVLMIVYGSPKDIDFIKFLVQAIRAAAPEFPGIPSDPPPLPLQLADPARLRREMEDAGLRDVRVDSTSEELVFRSGDELWHWLCNSNPIVDHILDELGLTADQRSTIRGALDELVEERADSDGNAVLSNVVHVGVGTK